MVLPSSKEAATRATTLFGRRWDARGGPEGRCRPSTFRDGVTGTVCGRCLAHRRPCRSHNGGFRACTFSATRALEAERRLTAEDAEGAEVDQIARSPPTVPIPITADSVPGTYFARPPARVTRVTQER
jgi:hypothetical protein